MSDNQWPPVPVPNPLLPIDLQRQHQMPHSSTTRELEIAQKLTQRYRHSAQQVVLSNATCEGGRGGDNALRPSALIRDIPLTPLGNLVPDSTTLLTQHYHALQSTAQLEVITDSHGPVLGVNESVRGGSTLFKLQAICPFVAFARLRLGAQASEEPMIGFSPAERGNLLHDSLAAIWRELKDSTGLATHDAMALRALVNVVTTTVIASARTRSPRRLGRRYCELEQQRLENALCEWLEGERGRPPFTVIAIEQERVVDFAKLQLTLRIDRIDEFANGDRLLIDYKTGHATSKYWQGKRMNEPQLPLYALTRDDITAIAFAQINPKQQKWDGLGELHDSSLAQPGIRLADNWSEQREIWEQELYKLACDFIEGDARVDFKDSTALEQAADLAPLTRLADAEALYLFLHGRGQ